MNADEPWTTMEYVEMPFDPMRMDLRLVVARALALEHGAPLGFHEEEDQLDFDAKAVRLLQEIGATLVLTTSTESAHRA